LRPIGYVLKPAYRLIVQAVLMFLDIPDKKVKIVISTSDHLTFVRVSERQPTLMIMIDLLA
jgi:hypothetical protein